MDKYKIKTISINEKVGVITWFGIFRVEKNIEMCRCYDKSSAHFVCNALNEKALSEELNKRTGH